MTEKSAKIKPIAILVCDEIRVEPDTSETFFGVLNSGAWLIYGEARVQPLAISFVFEVIESGVLQFELDISGEPLQNRVHLSSKSDYIEVSKHEHEYSSATAGNLELDLIQDGAIYFKWRHSERDDWELLRTIRIKPKERPKWAEVSGLTASPGSSIHTATTSVANVRKRPS